MTYSCPRGHQSSDADYCSECGSRINAAALQASAGMSSAAPSPASAPVAGSDICPDCATQRPAGAKFCEVCRYDFQTRRSFTGAAVAPAIVASVAAAPVATPAPAVVAPPITPASSVPMQGPAVDTVADIVIAQRLQLRIVVDPSLDTEPDPDSPCPVGQPDRLFHLDLEENTLGRQYDGKGIYPEVVVNDPGISRRHVKFLRQADGSFAVLELGSANGTLFNGKNLEPGILTPVHPGDELVVGMWTRIKVEAR